MGLLLRSEKAVKWVLSLMGLLVIPLASLFFAFIGWGTLSLIAIGFSYLTIIYIVDNYLKSHRKQLWQVPILYIALTIFLAILFMGALDTLDVTLKDLKYPGLFDYFYFSVITMTSVGYGDLTPVTEIGKKASLAMSLIGSAHMLLSISIFLDKVKNEP